MAGNGFCFPTRYRNPSGQPDGSWSNLPKHGIEKVRRKTLIDSFFSRLPESLLPEEKALKSLLGKLAKLASDFFPPDMGPSIQLWAERRIPGNIKFDIDEDGMATLQPFEVGTMPQTTLESLDWLDTLPQDGYTEDELSLHDALLEACKTRGKRTGLLQEIVEDTNVFARSAFLPDFVALKDWIDWRMGGDKLKIYLGECGSFMCQYHVPPSSEDATQKFFAELPENTFSAQEDNMRDQIYMFISNAKQSELIPFSELCGYSGVKNAEKGFLTGQVSILDWIENRMAEEIVVEYDDEVYLKLTDFGREILESVVNDDGAKGSEQSNHDGDDETYETVAVETKTASVIDSFMAALPSDRFTPAETGLRLALIEFLKGWHLPRPATTEDATSIDEVMRAKKRLLPPKGVPLRAWIDGRIGEEIETAQPPSAKKASIVFLALRGSMKPDVSRWVKETAQSLTKMRNLKQRDAKHSKQSKRDAKHLQAESDGQLHKRPRTGWI